MDQILIGKGERPVSLLARYGNRHGLIAGATGTGKTVSLMVLAEGFSRLGVPVFMADVKGDVAGLALVSRPTYLTCTPIARSRGSTNDQPPMFSDSSCTHSHSLAFL